MTTFFECVGVSYSWKIKQVTEYMAGAGLLSFERNGYLLTIKTRLMLL